MELATFAFDPTELKFVDSTAPTADLKLLIPRLVNEIYLAWADSLNATAPSPTTQRLSASLKRNALGASGVEVFEISFLRQSDASAVATFIARVHPSEDSRTRARQELLLAEALSRSARDEMCCRILRGQFLDGRAVVYNHAGPEFRRIDDVMVGLFATAEDTAFSLFLESLEDFLRVATGVYDDFTKACSELPISQYLSHAASELPPDLVIDLRREQPSTSAGTISLLKSSQARTRSLTPGGLIELVSNKNQKPVAVSVEFAIDRVYQSRYATLPLTLLRAANVEVWLLVGSQLSNDPILAGKTLRLELMLPSASIRTSTEVLAECGFPPASVRPRSACLKLLSESAPAELRAALRHRDVHSGNVLATPTQLRLVDLGDVNEDLVGVDVSRLEVSLVRRLIDRLGLNLADIHAVIGALAESSDERLERRLHRVVLLIAALRRAAKYVREKHNCSESQISLARLLQVMYHQRYLMAEVLGTTTVSRRDSFAAYCGAVWHEYEQATRESVPPARPRPRTEPATPATGPHLGQLWSRALSSDEGLLLPDAETVLRSIQRSVGRAWNNPLTDLQAELLNQEPGADGDPFTSQKHILLYGPTSCGKTTVADTFLVRTALLNVRRRLGMYIAPTRALAQEKYHELKDKLARTVLADGLVLSTGENLEQDHRIMTARFSIAVMVYEKANILFSRNRRALDRLGCVVVDEIHMIEVLDRGPMLELALTKIQDNRRRMDRRTDRRGENLRIVAISTEGADPGPLKDFLSVTDPDSLMPVPPLVFKGRKRPVPVAHHLVVPTSGPKSFDCPLVKRISQDSDRILTGEQRLEIARALQPAQIILSGARHGSSKTELQERLFTLLDSRIGKMRASGYRAVVFVPAKTDLESMADAFRARRHAMEDSLPPATLERLKTAAKSAGQMDTGHSVVLAATKGIFIHHSEVEPAARRIIEELLAEPLAPKSTQVVFATETLSYGVNLSVTDVVLFGTRFYTTSRRRVLSQEPVSVCEFHNMTGRAGRLGRGGDGDASAFILVNQEMNPFNEIVKMYYSEVPVLTSCLLDREDKAVLLEEFERDQFSLDGKVSFSQAFTYPFVRSLLDALRHLSVINSASRAFYAKVPLAELHSFLFRTLYAYQRLISVDSDPLVDRERELFKKAVNYTLQDLATFPLNLVDRDTRDGQDFYAITNRGEAIIDTGTEITTLKPLLEIVRKLRAWWVEGANGRRFPTTLYLLAVVSQIEAYRLIIRCAPEVSDADVSRLPVEDAFMNRRVVLDRFSAALSELGVVLPESMTPASLRDVLDKHLADEYAAPTRDNDFHGKYEGGLSDAVLRLFAAIAAWSHGGARSAVRGLILGESGDPIRSTQLSGFAGFRDQVSWKLVFLARILGAPDPHAAAILNTRDERELYSVALSVRIGCELQACRLIFSDYQESLSREEATELVSQGYSGDRLVQEPALSAPSSMPADRFTALRVRLCQEAAERYASLASTWTAALGPEPSEAELAALWDGTAKAFRSAIDCYDGAKVGLAQVEETLAVQAGWPAIIEGERRQLREPGLVGLADRTVLRFAAGTEVGSVHWALDAVVNDVEAPQRTLSVRGVQFLSDWSILTEHGGSGLNEALPSPGDEAAVVCVTFPWVPPVEAMPPTLKNALSLRSGRGQKVVFVSPAAFLLLLSGAVRGFLPVGDLFDFFASSVSSSNDHLITIGFDQAEEFLLAKGSSGSMPSALRESLLNHYELGFSARS